MCSAAAPCPPEGGTPVPAGRLPDPAVWRGRRVFITGHTGFKGAWLAVWLQLLGAEVTGLSLGDEPGTTGAALRITGRMASIDVDIRDPVRLQAALAQAAPEVVFHLAAQALVRHSHADPLGTWQTNVMGTASLLEAVRASPSVRAVVVVTSDKCYENRESPRPYREGDRLGGHDPYSASKAAAELVVSCWRRSFLRQREVSVASVRAGNVFGGGDWAADRLVPDCIRAFARRQPAVIRRPAATRPWQHVLDPLGGYLMLAERLLRDDSFARPWNFGPGPDEVRPVADIAMLLADAWGDGADWTSTGAAIGPHEAGLLSVDASLARTRLGWSTRMPLGEALRRTVDWHKRHLDGEDAHRLVVRDIVAHGAVAA